MAKTADLIVVGAVVEVKKGRTVGAAEEAIEFVDSLIRIQETLKGRYSADTITVETDPLQPFDPEWRRPGARVLLFLTQGDPESNGRYFPTNSQSAFALTGETLDATIQDPFAQCVATSSLSEVRAAIEGTVSP